jgi:translation initiation factor 2 subunit 1
MFSLHEILRIILRFIHALQSDNTEGMILLAELSHHHIHSIQTFIRVDRNKVDVVVRIDKEKGFIDLSKYRVSHEDIVNCKNNSRNPKPSPSFSATSLPSLHANSEPIIAARLIATQGDT